MSQRNALFKLFVAISFLFVAVNAFSSFWAPLYNPRILNYKVDRTFDPDGGKKARKDYQKKYGYRGERLIENLGNGVGPTEQDDRGYSVNVSTSST